MNGSAVTKKITAENPVIWADIPDPDVIKHGDAYYMISTTMYFCPGMPVMKSLDLLHWEIVSYVYDILEENDGCALRGGRNAYGKGTWAASLRYNGGIFYAVAASLNTKKTYIFKTLDIESSNWDRYVLDGVYHDPSLLFDDGGRVYLVYGGGAIRLIELNAGATAIMPGGIDRVIIENANAGGDGGLPAEGSHLYKIDGMYYLFLIAWPPSGTKRRIELCYRSACITGPYEGRVVLDDDMGDNNRGVAQGGLIEEDGGARYAMLFQDHGAVGRIPVLVPVSWEDGWPVFGIDGKVPSGYRIENGQLTIDNCSINGRGGTENIKPDDCDNGHSQPYGGIVTSDEFDTPILKLQWQWNHNPDNDYWSLAERPGFLRLKSCGISSGLLDARNTLTQRTYGPKCAAVTALETAGMKDGDTAGLAALQEKYGFVAVRATGADKYITAANTDESVPLTAQRVYLRIEFDFDGPDTARFYYSLNETQWNAIGGVLHMEYRLSHFTGYRFALFNYATIDAGGYVDFDYFRLCSH